MLKCSIPLPYINGKNGKDLWKLWKLTFLLASCMLCLGFDRFWHLLHVARRSGPFQLRVLNFEILWWKQVITGQNRKRPHRTSHYKSGPLKTCHSVSEHLTSSHGCHYQMFLKKTTHILLIRCCFVTDVTDIVVAWFNFDSVNKKYN